MASNIEVNSINEKINIWSISKCIFCNNELKNTSSKILECLHTICDVCVKKEKHDTGLKCKCSSFTKGELMVYPFPSSKICCVNSCKNESKVICNICEKVMCTPCAVEHVENHPNGATLQKFPSKPNMPCYIHSKKCLELYCTCCKQMICEICCLTDHVGHQVNNNFVEYSQDIKSNYYSIKFELEKKNKILDLCSKNTERQIQQLKVKNQSIKDDIDVKMNLLHTKINESTIKLKKLVDDNHSINFKKTLEYKEKLKDFQNENKYYFDLTQSILSQHSDLDIVNLSKVVTKKLDTVKYVSSLPSEIVDFSIDLVFNWDDSFKKCIAAIEEIGSTPILSSNPLKIESNTTNDTYNITTYKHLVENDNLYEASKSTKNQLVTGDNDSFSYDSDSSDFESLKECLACGQTADKLIQCSTCQRLYHNNCHIPLLSDDLLTSDWSCTLCEDILKYSKRLNKNNVEKSTSINENEQKIIERILLELYCQNNDSEHFRDCLHVHPEYFNRVTCPISLNDIKRRLINEKSYESINDVIQDIKLVFSNAISYYYKTDPFHVCAVNLQISLNKMISTWIPQLN